MFKCILCLQNMTILTVGKLYAHCISSLICAFHQDGSDVVVPVHTSLSKLLYIVWLIN